MYGYRLFTTVARARRVSLIRARNDSYSLQGLLLGVIVLYSNDRSNDRSQAFPGKDPHFHLTGYDNSVEINPDSSC